MFCNKLEKVATENKLCNPPGNIVKIDENGKQINNKPDIVITEKWSKNIHLLTSGVMSEKYCSDR